MRQEIVDRVRQQIAYELGRSGPPANFPKFPDMPRRRYSSDEFFELENERLWPKLWLYAGNERDLPERGSYFLWDRCGPQVIIIRSKDDRVRAFYNSCRHRGAPVIRDGKGQSNILRCQYHSWSYDTFGRLVSVPGQRDFIDLNLEDRCLIELRCESWGGWIFINRDPDAQPLIGYLGPLAEELAQFDCGNLRPVETRRHVIDANWKMVAEAFLEVYHFPHIHKPRADWGLGAFDLDPDGVAIELMPHGHSRMVTPFSKSAQAIRGMKDALDWRAEFAAGTDFKDIPTANEMVRSTSVAYNLGPNIMIPVEATGFPLLVIWPISVGQTLFEAVHMAPDWGEGDPPPLWGARMDGFDRIIEEDKQNMAPMQKSVSIPGAGVPLNYQERRIWYMNETIDRIIGRESIPESLRIPELLSRYVVTRSPELAA